MQIKELQVLLKNGDIKWAQHCLERMQERDINREDVKQCIWNKESVEECLTEIQLPIK